MTRRGEDSGHTDTSLVIDLPSLPRDPVRTEVVEKYDWVGTRSSSYRYSPLPNPIDRIDSLLGTDPLRGLGRPGNERVYPSTDALGWRRLAERPPPQGAKDGQYYGVPPTAPERGGYDRGVLQAGVFASWYRHRGIDDRGVPSSGSPDGAIDRIDFPLGPET